MSNVRIKYALAILAGVLLLGFSRPVTAAPEAQAGPPSEESLIAAWEDIQKNDPKTAVFEKTGAGQYHFATERFPYDGGLNVLNITIEALPGSVMGESYYGVIEVELPDLSEDFFRKYAYSYSSWQKNNYLYYNAGDAVWSTTTQWSATLAEEFDTGHGYGYSRYQSFFWIGALVVLLVVVLMGLRQVRTAMAQQKTALAGQETALEGQARALEIMERSLTLSEENNKIQKENAKLLKRIIETLEGK